MAAGCGCAAPRRANPAKSNTAAATGAPRHKSALSPGPYNLPASQKHITETGAALLFPRITCHTARPFPRPLDRPKGLKIPSHNEVEMLPMTLTWLATLATLSVDGVCVTTAAVAAASGRRSLISKSRRPEAAATTQKPQVSHALLCMAHCRVSKCERGNETGM